MIKAVVFDVGGVLIKGRIEEMNSTVADALRVDKELLNSFWKTHKEALSKGNLKLKDYCELVDKKFNVENSFEIHIKIYMDNDKKNLDEELLQLISRLKTKYKIGLISVVNDELFRLSWRSGFYKIFDVCILSCEVGFSKSEPGLYKTFLKKSGLKADECVIIDDRENPLKIAKSLGFKTILFKSNEQLKEELKKTGVNV